MYRLGIDVGGTNTDAIILDDQQHVINSVKRHTTKDIQTGITNAIQAVLADQQLDFDQINKAMLGTTQRIPQRKPFRRTLHGRKTWLPSCLENMPLSRVAMNMMGRS